MANLESGQNNYDLFWWTHQELKKSFVWNVEWIWCWGCEPYGEKKPLVFFQYYWKPDLVVSVDSVDIEHTVVCKSNLADSVNSTFTDSADDLDNN